MSDTIIKVLKVVFFVPYVLICLIFSIIEFPIVLIDSLYGLSFSRTFFDSLLNILGPKKEKKVEQTQEYSVKLDPLSPNKDWLK